jgi:hypothetical protein
MLHKLDAPHYILVGKYIVNVIKILFASMVRIQKKY